MSFLTAYFLAGSAFFAILAFLTAGALADWVIFAAAAGAGVGAGLALVGTATGFV